MALVGGTPNLPEFSGPTLSTFGPSGENAATLPVVVIETNFGGITVELDRQRAPITVENFLSYVERGQYDQTIVHQVFPKAVILAGGYTRSLRPIEPGASILNEAHNGLKNLRGTIAMYREPGDPHSGTCQFFINVKDNPIYDHKPPTFGSNLGVLAAVPPEDYGYCVFGKVIQGMEVVDRIASVELQDTELFERTPKTPVIIHSIKRIR